MKRVLFVCVGNSCRSQMAEGFFNHLAEAKGLAAVSESAGTSPAGSVSSGAIRAMKEEGIDISHHRSKALSREMIDRADVMITMGCGSEACPANFVGRAEDWEIEDPVGLPIEKFREVRDEIRKKIEKLVAHLSATVPPGCGYP